MVIQILPIYEAKAQEKDQIRGDLGRIPFRISFNNQESTHTSTWALWRINGPHLVCSVRNQFPLGSIKL